MEETCFIRLWLPANTKVTDWNTMTFYAEDGLWKTNKNSNFVN